ncbi:MAG: hypothetical protein K6A89_08665 [Treponema sp.]|nr:hypothetical protein [Treponema sp.]
MLIRSFTGCKSTKIENSKNTQVKNNSSIIIEDELYFDDLEFTESEPVYSQKAINAYTDESEQKEILAADENTEQQPYKYIFIRLYNPVYSNPFYIANILKGGIKATLINKEDDYSHSAINFTLDDDFYGLTSGGKYQLARESCVRPKENKYMKHGNPKKSTQVVYAMKVTEEEYEFVREYVKVYHESPSVRYNVFLNFQIGFFTINRKFFTAKEKKQFGNLKYPKTTYSKKKQQEYLYVENNFICSTFLAFVLENCIPKVRSWFEEKNINYRFVNVPDLMYIPGMTRLFSSTWSDYDEAVRQFVEEYPEFEDYLNKN